jgi:hypothetical protein
MYEINGYTKFGERDVYGDGCQLDGGFSFSDSCDFKDDTLKGLLEQVWFFTDGNMDCTELDACDEPGRIDVQIMEDSDGIKATNSQLEQWRQGEIELYSVTYIFDVSFVERRPVNFSEEF